MWEFWIDRGGTFTDLVARDPDGGLHSHKLLSENPEQYRDAAVAGMRALLGLGPDEDFPTDRVRSIRMGTTVATNALLERTGDRTVLAITAGFGDLLRIGYQNRPRLFDLDIVLPDLLHERVVEVVERVAVDGTVVTELDDEATRAGLEEAYADGVRAVAIALLHGHVHPDHERRVAAIAREVGFTQVSVSHEVSPLVKLVSRGDTTVVDAYLSPVLRRYIDRVVEAVGDVDLAFMQSSGGLTDATLFQGKDAILSGPAGGVVGMVEAGRRAGFDKLIGFDMGGTSTDVTHFAGTYERSFETEVAGVRLRAPMLEIHTVAAGGGSVLHFDGARFRVGPDSAGADPGPACYRRGGPLTVTDANVLLGRIDPDQFPAVFGPDADQPLDPEVVREEFEALAARVREATGDPDVAPESVAEGFLDIAVANMANAIKKISVMQGHDVTEYTLHAFGGAGGQHACRVADELGMETILLHPFAGVLSAYGMGLAAVRAMREQQVDVLLDRDGLSRAREVADQLAQEAGAELADQGLDPSAAEVSRRAHVRYLGSEQVLTIGLADVPAMATDFGEQHRQRFGFDAPDRALEIAAVIVEAAADPAAGPGAAGAGPRADEVDVHTQGGGARAVSPAGAGPRAGEVDVHPQSSDGPRTPGTVVTGPALLAEDTGTVVVDEGWQAEVDEACNLVMTRVTPRPSRLAVGTGVDPVLLEVFNNLFMSIAEQMGGTLANTSRSVNIKERLDFSCALFDADGMLVANAPHVPVHLGSMGVSVRSVIEANRDSGIRPGDSWMLNNPFAGGTHLPDVTVVAPVFAPEADQDAEPIFWVGSRGHHADIGGRTPGSSPPDSTHIDQEGVVLDNVRVLDEGRFLEDEVRRVLTEDASFPVRNVEQNLADLRAQVAANQTGIAEIIGMVERYGLDVVQAYMRHVQDNAEESVRRVIDVLGQRFGQGDGAFTLDLDGGQQIRVAITVDREARRATIDFTGTSDQDQGNRNAPLAVCRAAVLYVFRTLVDDDIPLNEGCLRAIDIVAPEGTIVNPTFPAAVVAGNTEVSQAITDALYGALGTVAGSQGTMNNLMYGNDEHQNYETICGGTGAGPDFDGASAVQSHMTNTRMTDPEVLEQRLPVRIDELGIRRDSGGAGRHRGGDGAVRRLRFLEPMTVTLVASNRVQRPFGQGGGQPGQPGRNVLERADGTVRDLGGDAEVEVQPGDVILIETPGGGGYGHVD